MSANKLLQAASGGAGESVYVDDVFATNLYKGDGGTGQTITNGIDLSGEGGMVWFKSRTTTNAHNIYDTARGNGQLLYANTAEPQYLNATNPWTPSSTGFNTGDDWGGSENQSGADTVAWSFRKQAGFFDVVTYTGDGSSTRNIAHNLGSAPGMIIVKVYSHSDSWQVYHRSLNDNSGNPYFLQLNSTAAQDTGGGNFTTPSATHFGVRTNINVSGYTYVAYLFAHDNQSFGDNSDESIIKCGGYTGSSSAVDINLGFEPQWLMIKGLDRACDWVMFDNMRPWPVGGTTHFLEANDSAAETTNFGNVVNITATGFSIPASTSSNVSESGEGYIYIAIRRPMKTPEAGTDVFSVYGYSDTGLTAGGITASNRVMINGGSNGGSGFPVDTFMHKSRNNSSYGIHVFDRIRGKGESLLTNLTSGSPAGDGATNSGFDYQEGVDAEYNGAIYYYTSAAGGRTHITYQWKRAPNFFDTVLYTGNGSNRTINHNLAQAPKFMFIKRHNGSRNWIGYFASLGNTKYLLGAGGAGTGQNAAATDDGTRFNSTTPTSSVFSVGTNEDVNGNNMQYVAYLWGDVDGVSKVGSYSSDGANDITINTGFTPRFVLIKCTSTTSTEWVYFDSDRGLNSGKYLFWNSNSVEQTIGSQYTIETTATTMIIKRGLSQINDYAAGHDYVFLAVA